MFKVVTRTHFSPAQRETVLEMSKQAIEIARRQPGFQGMRVHLATDGSHTLTLWEWATEADHVACTRSPDWADWNPAWEKLMAEGASFDLATYEVFATAD